MRKLRKRVLCLLLAAVLTLCLLPGQALAALIPALQEDRSWNAVRFNPSFRLTTQVHWKDGHSSAQDFVVPFDAASGSVMFCVDPGVPSSTDPKNYRVYIGNGNSRLDSVIAQAEADSKLGNVGSSGDRLDGTLSSEVLDSMDPSGLEQLIRYMSVLHYHAGKGVERSPSFGEGYNIYEVFAVQAYIWHLCNPTNVRDMWYIIGQLTPDDQNKVIEAFNYISAEDARLYGDRRLTSFTLGDRTTASSQSGAEAEPLVLENRDTETWTAGAGFSEIQYVCLDGRTVQRFRSGDSAKYGALTLTNTGSGVKAEIRGRADGTVYTARFLTTGVLPEEAVAEDWAIYAQAGSRYQSFFSVYRTPKSADMRLSFTKKADLFVTKVDADTGAGLRGAGLEVLDAQDNVIAAGETDEEGKLFFECPPPGEYRLRETEAPTGYELNENVYTFTVHEDGSTTGDTSVPNQRIGLAISKVEAGSGKGLYGAVIEVRDSSGAVIVSGKTDKKGYLAFDQPAPGTYTFREVSPPYGHKINDNEFTFTVHEDGSVSGDKIISDDPVDIPPAPKVKFPTLAFFQHKTDSVGGYDGNTCTPVGDAPLDASFTVSWKTDLGASGRHTATADVYGHGAAVKIFPWGFDGTPSLVVSEEIEMKEWDPTQAEGGEVEGEGGAPAGGGEAPAPGGEGEGGEGEGEEVEKIEFEASYTWTGSCTVTVTESSAPAGRDGSSASYTHTVEFWAYTEREDPYAEWSPVEYSITVDGRDTGLNTESAVSATRASPYRVNEARPDSFVNRAWTGSLQIIKTRDNDDIFDVTHGQGTVAGGAVSGAEYSTKSRWTLRLVSSSVDGESVQEASRFQGYESCPYVKVAEDPAMQNSAVGRLMHCYKVQLNGSGTPADSSHPLTPSQFGQIFISGLPYGTYLLTEHRADGERYVKESMFFTIDRDGQVISTSIHNSAKENVVRMVKVDAETGKTVPSAGTAFRIRYLGSPEYADPKKTPNYGRYLPNAASLGAQAASADDYIFFTDAAGEAGIPYALPYGSYQVEELLVPEGYYIGRYGEDGKAGSAGGTADSYGPGDDNHQTTGPDAMSFDSRVSIYNAQGERVDYTRDEGVVYQYYTFEVTKQADHVDGAPYQTYELTVELANTAAKGSIELTKLGEQLTGWRETTDAYGNTVTEPVYTQVPVSGAVFGVYAAEDILLEDGEEPPTAWDKTAGEPLELAEQVLSHVQFPQAESVRAAVHAATGAEVIQRIQRQTEYGGERNYAYVDYLTPTQKGTVCTLDFTRRDETAGLTYDYRLSFALEYSAGGWNYTDIRLTRTITADDYVAELGAALPHLYNGDAPADYSQSRSFSNGNRLEVRENAIDGKAGVYNDYDLSANDYELQEVTGSSLLPLPVQIPEEERWDRLIDLPELPEGYAPGAIRSNQVTITNGTAGEEMAAVWVTRVEDVEPELPDPPEDAGALAPPIMAPPIRRGVEWVRLDELDTLPDFDPSQDYYEPAWSLDGLTVTGAAGGALDFSAYGYEEVTPLYATASALYVSMADERFTVWFSGEQLMDGTIQSIDSIALVPEGEEPPAGSYDGPDPGSYPLPEGYKYLTDRFGVIMAYNEQADAWMTFVREGSGEYRWIHCDKDGDAYRVRRQSLSLSLTQPNTSPDGWRFDLDGIVLTNAARDEASASAVLSVPYDQAEPVISDYMGCEVSTEQLAEGGTRTSVTIRHPVAPVDFEMIDGTRVELVYLGSYTKTTVTVPGENALPTVTRKGKEVDWFDQANGGLTPEHPFHEVQLGGGSYTRATRNEAAAGRGASYTLELVSDARDMDSALIVDYHGAYQSAALCVTDAATGALRGDLRFRALYKTMRYPLSALVETLTTDETGTARSGALPLGNYVVRELSAPDGLTASGVSYPLTLAWKDQFTPLVWASQSVENDAVRVQLDIAKGFQKELNSADYEPRAGAVFGVYTYEEIGGLSAGTLVATVVTGGDGKAVETLKLPRGSYFVQELRTLDGYEPSRDRFLFRAEELMQSGALAFSCEAAGMFAKVVHSGYKTAQAEFTVYAQIPMPRLTVNGVAYDLTRALAEGTVGNGVLVHSAVDADRTVFTVTAAAGEPAVIEFSGGVKLELEVGETGFTAALTDSEDAALQVEVPAAGAVSLVSRTGRTSVYAYDPLTAFTGYTAQTSTIYTPPQTVLTGAGGATLSYAYDLARGVKLAVVSWPEGRSYYPEPPVRDVPYYLGDLDRDGGIDGDDLAILAAALEPEGAALTEDQQLLADLDGSGAVDEADLEALTALAAGLASGELLLEEHKQLTLQEEYLPEDAITFDTAGFGNAAYAGSEVDRERRTVTIDLSKFDFDQGPYHVYVGEDTVVLTATGQISLESACVRAESSATGRPVPDGYQPDSLLLEGNTLFSKNRTLELSSYGGTGAVRLELAHDHSLALLEVLRGDVTSAYLSGAPLTVEGTVSVAPGNSVTLLMADGAVFRIGLSNTGYAQLSVEGITAGALDGEKIPLLRVNGSADNFIGTDYRIITQRVPMDETSIDDVRQYNTQSVTLARSDSFVTQLQVKINAVGAPADQTGGVPERPDPDTSDGVTAKPIENNLKPYISKVSVTTAEGLAGARIEIYDANGVVVAAGESDATGRFYFAKPEPGTYLFREVSAPEGYLLNETVFTFVVHPDGDITGDNTIEDEPVPPPPVPIEPETPGIRVSARKLWEGDDEEQRPKRVTVRLLNGETVWRTAVLSDTNGWSCVWTDLPYGRWRVEEVDVPEGYVSEVSHSGRNFTIVNMWDEPIPDEPTPLEPGPDGQASVRKVWLGGDEELRPQSVEVQLLKDGAVYDTVTLSEENSWSHLWTGLPEGSWTVSEPEPPEGYTSQVRNNGTEFTVINTWNEPRLSVHVEKRWEGDDEELRPQSVEVQLLRDGTVYDTVTLSEATGWRHTWMDLPEGSWSVAEGDVPAGYVSEVLQDGRSFTVVNTWDEPRLSVHVEKRWEGDDEELRPQSVEVQLLKDGAVYDTVTLSEATGWQHTWTDLPEGGWSVAEGDVPAGYVSEVLRDGWSFTVVNSWDEPIPDDPPPEGDIPKTGDSLTMWLAAAAASGLGLVWTGLTGRKKKHTR